MNVLPGYFLFCQWYYSKVDSWSCSVCLMSVAHEKGEYLGQRLPLNTEKERKEKVEANSFKSEVITTIYMCLPL